MPARMGLPVLQQQPEGHGHSDVLNTGLGRSRVYQTTARTPRRKEKVCQTAYQRLPGEETGRSDSPWITTVYLFILLTLEKEHNLIGASS